MDYFIDFIREMAEELKKINKTLAAENNRKGINKGDHLWIRINDDPTIHHVKVITTNKNVFHAEFVDAFLSRWLEYGDVKIVEQDTKG